MTCIIGLLDKGKVYVAGDSAASTGYSVQVRADKKVFRNGNFLIGFTTSFRMGQLLQYSLIPPAHDDNLDTMRYMVSEFIPAVRQCLSDGGHAKKENNQEQINADFVVGYRQRLFVVHSDLQVAEPMDGIVCVGSGGDIALGAMYALAESPPKARITKALELATYLCEGVRPPYVIEEL